MAPAPDAGPPRGATALAGLRARAVTRAQGVTAAARSGAALLGEAREAVRAVRLLTARTDALVAELEEPLRALAPGLRRLAAVLDDPVVADLPVTLRRLQDDLLPVLRTLADTHDRVASVAGQTDRIMSFVDETGRSLAGMTGTSRPGRRRPAAPIVTAAPIVLGPAAG